MSGFEMSTAINRPVEDGFAVLADLVNDPKWRREWVDARATTDGSLGVAGHCVLVGKAMGQRTEAEYEINDVEPNRRSAKKLAGPLLAAMGKRALAGDFPQLKELLDAQP